MSDKLYSKHIFMFPFNWDYINANQFKKAKTKVSIDIKAFEKLVEENDEWQQVWVKDFFKCSTHKEYNEKNYFYNSVSRAIYSKFNESNIVNNYKYKINKKDENKYIIKIKNNDEIDEFKLDIDEINLQVYKTGVALLSFKISNYIYSEKEDILLINNYGRRISIPFFEVNSKENKLELPINEVPHEIILKIGNIEIKQNFNDYLNIKEEDNIKCGISKIITGVLGEKLFKNLNTDKDRCNDCILIKPTIDDRMYVMCWYGNNSLVEYIGENGLDLSKRKMLNFYDIYNNKYTYEENDFWYKYIFVDGKNRSCNSIPMLNKLLKENTYDRWADYGTLYGASRYSFMELTSTYDVLLENKAEYIVNHFESMYYRMIGLILIQRACILRFSERVADISIKLNSVHNNSKFINEAEGIYESYLEFVNNIFFREFTAQDQGIELHKLIVNSIDLEEDVNKLKNEIEELHNLILLKADKQTANNLKILTLIGTIVTIPSFLVSYIGYFGEMDVIEYFKFNNINEILGGIVIISAITILILAIIWLGRYIRKRVF